MAGRRYTSAHQRGFKMSATDDLKARWAENRSLRSMGRAYEAMKPYLHNEKCDLAMVMVSGVAQLVAFGIENSKALDYAVLKASKFSGIPVDALQVHADSVVAKMESFKIDSWE